MKRNRRLLFWTIFFIILLSPLIFLWLNLKEIKKIVREKTPQNLLLITIDTLKADRLGCYGNERIYTPIIDRIAKRGVQFTDTWAHIPITNPSHCTIFTGLYPYRFGFLTNGKPLGKNFELLTEKFKLKDYKTAAFVSGYSLVSKISGLQRYFDLYDDKWSERKVERRAYATTSQAIKWIDKNRDSPFFVWVHYFDPHRPYDPPAFYRDFYIKNAQDKANPSPEIKEKYKKFMEEKRKNKSSLPLLVGTKFGEKGTEENFQSKLALYDGEISYVDSQLERLLTFLNEKNLADNTLIIITSDHGEGFDHDYYYFHGDRVYESSLKVPLLFLFPERFKIHGLRDVIVQLVDLYPTIKSIFFLKKTTKKIDGTSFYKYLKNTGFVNKQVFKKMVALSPRLKWRKQNKGALLTIRANEWKIIKNLDTNEVEIFNLEKDPAEEEDLSTKGGFPKYLVSLLRDYEREINKSVFNPKLETLDEQTRENLRKLGYVK